MIRQWECSCADVHSEAHGYVGKSRSGSCEIHGSTEATLAYAPKCDECGQPRWTVDDTGRCAACTRVAIQPPDGFVYHKEKQEGPFGKWPEVLRMHAGTLRRANALADRCQTLEDEKRDLLSEIGQLRREADRRGRR